MFGHPSGLLGSFGGRLMARTNRGCAAWVAECLALAPHERILEIGFGPGEGIAAVLAAAPTAEIAGVDPSPVMLAMARRCNHAAIAAGRVSLVEGSAERLPFDDTSFEAAFAINSFQLWQDAPAGLREIRRVLRTGGRIALGFTPHSLQQREGLVESLTAAGFEDARLIDRDQNFGVLAIRP
ncbi:class I SAM-dependent methyltransferase [Rhizobium jaguaris]|uniref:class I SAM-dependent methyltransferase n=1 Tax=Rhizobium jaguaris TaxID=1312183 RepID=UPI0039BF1BA7